jgi:tetratricopeptide (TPR) repeat protein
VNILDKEEFRIKLEEINRLVEQKNYKDAMEVVDSIDWRRVKNVHTLCVVGEIYAANKRYDDSREIFLLAYHRAPIGRNILYRLIEVSLKMKDIDEAMEYYDEFLEVAPNDSTQYVLKYKIRKAEQAPLEEQIRILEDYKEKEFTERWSYELAKLYYQNGDTKKCLDLCDEMVLWFSDGKYVMKALDLKSRMGMLTGSEKEKYDRQFIPKLKTVEESEELKTESPSEENTESAAVSEDDAPVIESVDIDERDVNGAESLQEKISKGIRDIFTGKKKEADNDLTKEEEETPAEAVQEEMIKDISSEAEPTNVPELEPEDAIIPPPKTSGTSVFSTIEEKIENVTEQEIQKEEQGNPEEAAEDELPDVVIENVEEEEGVSAVEEETVEAEEISTVEEVSEPEEIEETVQEKETKLPELEIPEAMKNVGMENPLHTEIPKAPNICLPGAEDDDTQDFEFNLEDMILEAATAQGIEIPKEPIVEEKTPVQEVTEEESEDYMTEEDLRSAEEEFLNGPVKKEKPEEEIYDDLDSYEMEDDSYEDFSEEDGYEDEDITELEDEDFFTDQYEETIKPSRSSGKKSESRKARKGELEEEDMEQLLYTVEPKRKERDIIPREKKMTSEEEKLFTYFAKVPGLREQIVDALYDAQICASDKTSRTGNIIVMGGRETGKTRLISGLIPAICKQLNLEASKVAYVFADQINGKNIADIVRKMSGGFLVIENANQLTKETVNQLNKAMEFRTDGLIVIIEDEKIGMRKLIARFPKFTSKFTSMINIPVFTNDELVNFAKIYTRENGYTIDQMAMLSLYNLISTNQKEDQPMNIGAVKDIIDGAISKSRGGLRKLISKKKVNQDGYLVLYEKDFN